MARVPASEKTRNALKDMFAGKTAVDRSSLVRQAARLIVEEALESEAADTLGRGYYEYGANERGYRNGYRLGEVKRLRVQSSLPCRSLQICRSRFARRFRR